MHETAFYPLLDLTSQGEVTYKFWHCNNFVRGASCWWSLLAIVSLLRGADMIGASNRYIANHWAQRVRHCSIVAPAHCMLRRAIDRSGADRNWTRTPSAPTCSIVGLLVL